MGVLYVEADGTIAGENPAARRILGRPGGLVGRQVDDLLPPERREAHREARRGFAREGGSRPMGRGRYLASVREDGSLTRVEVGLTAVRGGVVATVLDLEAAERLLLVPPAEEGQRPEGGEVEDALRARSAAALTRLTAHMAHEFNNLAQVMLSAAEGALEGPDDPQRALSALRDAALRVSALTRSLTESRGLDGFTDSNVGLRAVPEGAEASQESVVLLAEDEPELRAQLARSLEQAGYPVLVAANGREALEIAQGGTPFEILVTDILMPEVDGVLLATLLREERRDLPVLFITGHAGYPSRLEGDPVLRGALALRKPFGLAELLEVLRTLCASLRDKRSA